MRFVILVAVALLSLSTFAQKEEEIPRVEPSSKGEVGVLLEWTTPEGQEYWYRLPKESQRGRKPALVIMLHGTGTNHGWSFWNYPIVNNGGTFRPMDIIVSPDGLTPGGNNTFNFVQNELDGAQIANLIEYFHERFDIGNVYLYGHSQGAFFCYWFVGEYPELVDGIVAHAGNVLANVRHPKLAKANVAIGILHARADQVVPAECAERTRDVYEAEEYAKLKCWIIEEGIGDHAGHWPLPDHVTTMFEWLDTVSTKSPAQGVDVALTALKRESPDWAVAVRATLDARSRLKKYKGADRDELEGKLDKLEGVLDRAATKAWTHVAGLLEANDRGKKIGPWAADVRALRRSFDGWSAWDKSARPLSSKFKSHDKAFAKLDKLDESNLKKYPKKLLQTLEGSWLSKGWDARVVAEQGRAEKGIRAVKPIATDLDELVALGGGESAGPAAEALGEVVKGFFEANPDLGDG